MSRPLRILIADDTITNVRQLEAVARKLGHEVVVAMDGQEAVERYHALPPDLVFMDIMMPRMDGIAAVAKIRSVPSERWVPIIFFSALDSPQDIVRGLEAGGDDYLVKPTNLQVIRAKINSYARLLAVQDDIHAYTAELRAWREDAEEQNQLGNFVISRLVDAEGLRDPAIRWKNIPATTFSGDLVCAARAPGNLLYLMLADAAGHGLSAALTALPLTQVFYGMSSKGFPIHSIAEELNRKLKAFLPVDRFVATTLVALDTRNQTIEIWNGGNPEVLFITGDGETAMRWPPRHPPLGILPPSLFSSATETYNYHRAGELVLCSDGVIEAENPAGLRMRMEGVEALLRSMPPGRRFAALESGIEAHLAGRRDHDDISWLVTSVALEPRPESHPRHIPASAAERISEWRMELTWGAAELRRIDVVPAVMGFISQVEALEPHQGPLFLIVSELFNNALDHGLLRLDSAIKNAEGGFERYLDERARRLEALASGRIDMRFLLHLPDGDPVMDIGISDSGDGFDFSRVGIGPGDPEDPNRVHGRGIDLVRSLCAQVTYVGKGNQALARYAL